MLKSNSKRDSLRSYKRPFIAFIIVGLGILLYTQHHLFSWPHCVDPITAIIQRYQKTEQFSGVVLLATRDQIIFEQAYSNSYQKTPNSCSSQFLIGSITKQFSAAALLLLLQQQKIGSLDDPIISYIPSSYFKNPIPEGFSLITFNHLLSHSACLPSYIGFNDFEEFYSTVHTSQELFNYIISQDLLCTPGSHYRYSGSGYNVIGCLIEIIAGMPYQTFLQNNIFKKATMHSSDADHSLIITSDTYLPLLAPGYNEEDNTLVPATDTNLSTIFAEGCIKSTARDLWHWNNALYQGKVIEEPFLEKMLTPHFTMEDDNTTAVGYGIFIDQSSGNPIYFHGGKVNGYSSALLYNPETTLSVVVLSNVYNVDCTHMAFELLEALPKEKI